MSKNPTHMADADIGCSTVGLPLDRMICHRRRISFEDLRHQDGVQKIRSDQISYVARCIFIHNLASEEVVVATKAHAKFYSSQSLKCYIYNFSFHYCLTNTATHHFIYNLVSDEHA